MMGVVVPSFPRASPPKASCGAFRSSARLSGIPRLGRIPAGALCTRSEARSPAVQSPSRGAMGINKLAEVIKEGAPDAVRPASLEQYRGRVVALDTSVAIYQFCTAMPQIINRHGQNISCLQGLFFRTLSLLEKGIQPVFVFDGKPPELKQRVLAKRATTSGARRGTADSDVPARPPRRDSETLLTLLGVPYIQAPAEAEATCAALVKSGHAWCVATEDMDALPFGAVRLLRHLSMKKSCLEEISLPTVLQKLGMTQEQFVDLCILLGCDYCHKIRGLGPKKALKLMQHHGSIEEVLRNTSRQSHPMPDGWCLEETRRLFLQPEVTDPGQVMLEWKEPDEEGLVKFLAQEKCMKESRVRGRRKRWRDARLKLSEASKSKGKGKSRKATASQAMTDFFPVMKRPNKSPTHQSPRKKKQKRQEEETEVPGRRSGSARKKKQKCQEEETKVPGRRSGSAGKKRRKCRGSSETDPGIGTVSSLAHSLVLPELGSVPADVSLPN
ncbi:probable flap endonuclease 1 homolog isoform X1 [Crotalus tigris]|uniref:probable flap endonuclease 1 homolog isoform X1 n=1 Tax=Crotalus tigris TaxID=88082 RepID=UPI00192F2229|nr:probable flap endonuclease 1 homolog isoform X1 [Crotalus tigris]